MANALMATRLSEDARAMDNKERLSSSRLWVARLLVVLCPLIALPSLWLGGHDAMLGVRLGQRLVGVLLALCGVALLAASLLFLVEDFRHVTHGDRYVVGERTRVAPAGFLLGAVPGAVLSIVQVSALIGRRNIDWGIDWRLLIWLVAALIPLATAVLLWPMHRPESFGPVAKVVTVLSAAGVLGLGQSFLTSYYAPVRQGDSLSVTTRLVPSELPRNKGVPPTQALRGTVSIENSGDVKLVFLGGMYLVTGYNTLPPRHRRTPLGEPDDFGNPFGGLGRFETKPYALQHIKSHPFYDPGSNWIAAETKVEADFLAYAPKDRFERYVSTVILVTARGDRIRLGKRERPVALEGGQVRVATPVLETSRVNELTRKPLRLLMTYGLPGSPNFPQVTACVAPKDSYCSKDLEVRRRLNDSYGVNIFPAWYSLQMPSKP